MKNPENMTMMFFAVMWDDARYASLLPEIEPDANKYSRGSVAVVGGSDRYTGAPIMAAQAASKTGAGYTTLVVPAHMEQTARSHVLSIPVIAVEADPGSPMSVSSSMGPDMALAALRAMRHLDAVVAGPGMGTAPAVRRLISGLVSEIECPLVIDADGLNAIAGVQAPIEGASSTSLIDELAARSARGLATILTPHDGELARLSLACVEGGYELPSGIIGAGSRELDALTVHGCTGATVVAKGPTTLVVSDSRSLESNKGTPALAKAGTGDVLAGIIGSLAAQGLDPLDAAALGVHLHSVAGICASETLGEASVMAEDVIGAIPAAIERVRRSKGA